MRKISKKKITLAGLFIALGLLMPFLTAQIPSIGSKLLPCIFRYCYAVLFCVGLMF